MRQIVHLSLLLLVLLISFTVSCCSQELTDRILFTNENGSAVTNGPTSPTTFTLKQPMLLTGISTYHYNGGTGAPAGTIEIVSSNKAFSTKGQATLVKKFYWSRSLFLVLSADTYTIVDSSPNTWSKNSRSKGMGFYTITGKDLATLPDPLIKTIYTNESNLSDHPAGFHGTRDAPFRFFLTELTNISYFRTYHKIDIPPSNKPYLLEIKNSKGVSMGTWPAAVYNAHYLFAEVNEIFPMDNYTVIDPLPDNTLVQTGYKISVAGKKVIPIVKGPVQSIFTSREYQTPITNTKGVVAIPRNIYSNTDKSDTNFIALRTNVSVGGANLILLKSLKSEDTERTVTYKTEDDQSGKYLTMLAELKLAPVSGSSMVQYEIPFKPKAPGKGIINVYRIENATGEKTLLLEVPYTVR